MMTNRIRYGVTASCAVLFALTIGWTATGSLAAAQEANANEQWISLFDGHSMEGWEKVGGEDSQWEVKDGALVGTGGASMLVHTSGPYTNFRYRVEIKINDGGNSGVYFRTTPRPGFLDGYEAQVNSSHTDPILTGSLYGFCHVYAQHVKPDTWFTYEIEVKDDVWRGREMTRIKITVDGNELYEHLDFAKTYGPGHFAFQQHDPGSIVQIRKVEVLPLDGGADSANRNRPAATEEKIERQGGTQVPKHFERTVTHEQSLDYLLFLPRDYDAERAEGWPLMVFLHGAGERGDDLSLVKVHGPPKLVESDPDFPFVLVSPQCPEGEIWDASELSGLLDEVIDQHNVDPERVYLTGLSMGGFGTWSLGMSQPERFAAIAPICGGGARLAVQLAGDSKKELLKQLPVWAFHGEKDSVVPVEESQRMVDALKQIGSQDVKLTVYPEAGHDSWTETYENPEFFQWLLQQKNEDYN